MLVYCFTAIRLLNTQGPFLQISYSFLNLAVIMGNTTGIKRYWEITKEVFLRFIANNPMLYAANIAFYTIFSLPAMLIIIIAIAGNFFAREAVTGELYHQIRDFVGSNSALEIQQIIENAHRSESGIITTIIGIATLLFSATTVFVSIQSALNAIWEVKPQPEKGIIKFIVDRVLSFALVVTLGFLMMVSLVLDALLSAFKGFLKNIFSDITYYIMEIINFSISITVITFVFAMVFKFLPDAKIKWRDVGIGAVVTTALFILGKFLISFYISNSDFENTYGAAGALVVILMWVYYSSVILLIGAEFTQAYVKSKGRMILPAKNAIKVEVREVELDK